MKLRALPSALISLHVALTGLPSAQAQLLVVTAGESQSVSRTLRVDTSMAVRGTGLIVPGPINTAVVLPLESVAAATLRADFSDGTTTTITGRLTDFTDPLPSQIKRNSAGDGLLNASSRPASPSAISVSTSVPAITALGAGEAATNATTLRLDLLTVFP